MQNHIFVWKSAFILFILNQCIARNQKKITNAADSIVQIFISFILFSISKKKIQNEKKNNFFNIYSNNFKQQKKSLARSSMLKCCVDWIQPIATDAFKCCWFMYKIKCVFKLILNVMDVPWMTVCFNVGPDERKKGSQNGFFSICFAF